MGDRSKTDARRVLRGGSWINNGRNCRSAIRNENSPDNRNNNIGFRLSLAQDVIGIRINDQIVILSCGSLQAKSKATDTLVMGADAP